MYNIGVQCTASYSHSPTGGRPTVVLSQTDREVVEYGVRAGAYTGHSDQDSLQSGKPLCFYFYEVKYPRPGTVKIREPSLQHVLREGPPSCFRIIALEQVLHTLCFVYIPKVR